MEDKIRKQISLERDNYLRELTDAVHYYIESGIKTEQLDKWLRKEDEFKERYRRRFNTDSLVRRIAEENEKNLLNEYTSEEYKNSQGNNLENVLQNYKEMVITRIIKSISKTLSDVIKDTAYLSYVNSLYELYEKQEKIQRERKEFKRVSKQYVSMENITKLVNEKNRMQLDELKKKLDLPSEDLDNVLYSCKKYFNLRENRLGVQISLSPIGAKYYKYLLGGERRYSDEDVSYLVYKNCNSFIESFEKSKKSRIIYNVKLEGITPDKERCLRDKYYQILDDYIDNYIDNNDDRYALIGSSDMEVSDRYETNGFEFTDGWCERI